jgi:2-keto-4-pentenoate hydratase/2-oxohepta-3-ene-1,7-dioic acid hydratase in catechol pathway
MKLVRFGEDRIGVVTGRGVVDVTHLSPVPAAIWPPIGMVALIAAFDRLRPEVEAAAQTGAAVPLDSVRLLAPVIWPNKLLAYPANYYKHIEEMSSRNRADINGFFLKAASSIVGPRDAIVLPELPGREIHHECELAIFIGKGGRHIPREAALDHIFGYACLMDMTVRGQEERVMRKSFDSFTPIGPWIVTRDEIADPGGLDMELTVNGEIRQKANTRDLILDIPGMISLASSVTTLQPGDIIATGTPEGVGPLRGGDSVTIRIAGVGEMTLPVVQGKGGGNIAFNRPRAA